MLLVRPREFLAIMLMQEERTDRQRKKCLFRMTALFLCSFKYISTHYRQSTTLVTNMCLKTVYTHLLHFFSELIGCTLVEPLRDSPMFSENRTRFVNLTLLLISWSAQSFVSLEQATTSYDGGAAGVQSLRNRRSEWANKQVTRTADYLWRFFPENIGLPCNN